MFETLSSEATPEAVALGAGLLDQGLTVEQPSLMGEVISSPNIAVKRLGSGALFGAAARQAQALNMTAQVPQQPKAKYFAN